MYRLNLLPKERKQQLRRHLLARSGFTVLLLFTVVSLGISLALFVASSILATALRTQQQKTQQTVANTLQQQGELPQEKIRQLNALISRVTAIQKTHTAVIPLVNMLTELIPDGITVATLDIDPQKLTVGMAGTAATRQTLLSLENNFSSSENLKNVTNPVSNLLQRENIPFTINATMILP